MLLVARSLQLDCRHVKFATTSHAIVLTEGRLEDSITLVDPLDQQHNLLRSVTDEHLDFVKAGLKEQTRKCVLDPRSFVAELMDEVGFWAIETWGGATFDTMHRFLNEDPWERLRILKRYIKKTFLLRMERDSANISCLGIS